MTADDRTDNNRLAPQQAPQGDPGLVRRGTIERLVRRAQHNKHAHFEKLFRAIQASVYYTALAHTNNATDANDVAQIAFVKIYDNLETLRSPKAFTTWVNQIVTNTANTELRRRHRSTEVLADDATMTALSDQSLAAGTTTNSDAANPEQHIEHAEDLKLLRHFIEELPPTLKDMTLLHYLHGLSINEIAARLGISPNTVAVRLTRARTKLRQQAERYTATADTTADTTAPADTPDPKQPLTLPLVVAATAAAHTSPDFDALLARLAQQRPVAVTGIKQPTVPATLWDHVHAAISDPTRTADLLTPTATTATTATALAPAAANTATKAAAFLGTTAGKLATATFGLVLVAATAAGFATLKNVRGGGILRTI